MVHQSTNKKQLSGWGKQKQVPHVHRSKRMLKGRKYLYIHSRMQHAMCANVNARRQGTSSSVYAYIHTCMHTYIQTHVYVYIHRKRSTVSIKCFRKVYKPANIHTQTSSMLTCAVEPSGRRKSTWIGSSDIPIKTHIMCVCVYIYIHIYIYIYISVCVCMHDFVRYMSVRLCLHYFVRSGPVSYWNLIWAIPSHCASRGKYRFRYCYYLLAGWRKRACRQM